MYERYVPTKFNEWHSYSSKKKMKISQLPKICIFFLEYVSIGKGKALFADFNFTIRKKLKTTKALFKKKVCDEKLW